MPAPFVPDLPPLRPVTFNVGEHTLVLAKLAERRWTCTVDGRRLDATHDTEAEAWEAGVRHVYGLAAARR